MTATSNKGMNWHKVMITLTQIQKLCSFVKSIILLDGYLNAFTTEKRNHAFSLAENTLPLQDEETI